MSSPPIRARGRTLVLAGGGVGGIAWLVGFADGLADRGIDLAGADVLIGTSAGAAVAAQLATGQRAAAARMQQEEHTSELLVQFDMAEFFAAMERAAEAATSRRDAAYRMANVAPVDTSVTPEQRRAVVAARLPVRDWPERDLRVVAVARDSGERVVFDRTSGVDLLDAVLASCAVPGIWPPVRVAGRDCVDGGAWSLTNADLAAGAERTLVLVPGMLDDAGRALVEEELALLEGARTHVVSADDESVAAIGPNPLDPSTRPAVFAAARAQADRCAGEIERFWN